MRAWDIATLVGAAIGGICVIVASFNTFSAVQQAAEAAVGIGIALMPYLVSSTLHRARAERHRETMELVDRAEPAEPYPSSP
jgi:hypothetical protein